MNDNPCNSCPTEESCVTNCEELNDYLSKMQPAKPELAVKVKRGGYSRNKSGRNSWGTDWSKPIDYDKFKSH